MRILFYFLLRRIIAVYASCTGFGGRYGVQKDRMDKAAVGHDYVGKTEAHSSQKDYSQGKHSLDL